MIAAMSLLSALITCADQQRAAIEKRRLNSRSILTVFLWGLSIPGSRLQLAMQLTLCLVREGAYGLESHCANLLSVALNNNGP